MWAATPRWSGGWLNVIGALRPSPTRCAMRVSAASSPKATPLDFAGPSGIAANDAASAASSVAVAYGEYVTNTRWAAAATAADAEALRGACPENRYGWYRPPIPTTAL